MRFGRLTITARLHMISSLKMKRSLLKHVLSRLRKDYNISVIESGLHDSKDWTELTVSIVALASGQIDSIFESIERDVSTIDGLEVVGGERETW